MSTGCSQGNHANILMHFMVSDNSLKTFDLNISTYKNKEKKNKICILRRQSVIDKSGTAYEISCRRLPSSQLHTS